MIVAVIQVDHLRKRYGAVQAVRDVSFTVSRGEVVGFLGPNGAGKTTTMKVVTGYIPPTDGRALVAGFDVAASPLEVKRRIGYLPETCPLYGDMRVRDYLAFVAEVRGIPRRDRAAAIGAVIERCGLRGYTLRPIGQLSKGYRQRVGLAQAMIHGPDILILDEPTSGLDPHQIKEIRELIREVGREKTVILSTHILGEVAATCDRAIIIRAGRIVADGPIEDLTRRAAGRRVTQVGAIGADASFDDAVGGLAGVSSVRPLDEGGAGRPRRLSVESSVEAAAPHALERAVFALAVERGVELVELHQPAASLEDVFLELTGDRERPGAAP